MPGSSKELFLVRLLKVFKWYWLKRKCPTRQGLRPTTGTAGEACRPQLRGATRALEGDEPRSRAPQMQRCYAS